MPLKPAPDKPVPLDDTAIRILVDGDRCDTCGATAYVRVHILDLHTVQLGTLHFCAHHYRVNELALWGKSLAGTALIIDERRFLAELEAGRTKAAR